MTKFIHIRNYGDFASREEVDVKGGKTIAYTVESNVIKFAYANCSPRDNFCRKTGRIIAEGRLKSNKLSWTVTKREGQSDYEAIMEAL